MWLCEWLLLKTAGGNQRETIILSPVFLLKWITTNRNDCFIKLFIRILLESKEKGIVRYFLLDFLIQQIMRSEWNSKIVKCFCVSFESLEIDPVGGSGKTILQNDNSWEDHSFCHSRYRHLSILNTFSRLFIGPPSVVISTVSITAIKKKKLIAERISETGTPKILILSQMFQNIELFDFHCVPISNLYLLHHPTYPNLQNLIYSCRHPSRLKLG